MAAEELGDVVTVQAIADHPNRRGMPELAADLSLPDQPAGERARMVASSLRAAFSSSATSEFRVKARRVRTISICARSGIQLSPRSIG